MVMVLLGELGGVFTFRAYLSIRRSIDELPKYEGSEKGKFEYRPGSAIIFDGMVAGVADLTRGDRRSLFTY